MIAVISFIAWRIAYASTRSVRKCIFCATNLRDQNGAVVARAGGRRTAMVRRLRAIASRKGTPGPARGALSAPARLSTFPAMDARSIDELARRLAAAVPPGITALRRDLEDNFKAVLQSGLARLDLVSRQEFDVQAAVLRRTREKLEALEARLATLENGQKPPAGK
jgi:BMFP domain-containing protein YqiC